MTALRAHVTPPSAHTDEDLHARAAEALTDLRHVDRVAAELVEPYLALHATWPAGTVYLRVPTAMRATLDSLRARGGQPLVAAFHRSVLVSAMSATRPALCAHPAWSESLTLWDEAMDRILTGLPKRSDADLDYPSDLWAKDIALASGRLWHAGAQLVQPRMGLSRRLLLQGGAPTLARGVATLARMGGHYPLYELHAANHTLPYFNPDAWAECWRRIARALARDPEAKGVFGIAWFYDLAVERVSPHLAYLRQFPLERGAVLLKVATTETGRRSALANSFPRRALYEAGEYDPLEYLMIWPRRAALGWLRRSEGPTTHPSV
jgi:hypothetical protein